MGGKEMEKSNQYLGWVSDQGDGTYKNPVLYADYSDPDIVKVGDDFYMTSSSFNCTPALPILHSKDLVNWTIVNHISINIPLDVYNTPQHGKGIWAPTLKYHDGKVWMFVCTPDEGMFMSYAEDPKGEWSPLHHVKNIIGWIDCCPFWDDNGDAYVVHAFANSRVGLSSLLHLCKMSPDGKEITDIGKIIIDVMGKHHVLEGPRLFKRNGYYYVTAPAGGIEHGYQLIFRSKNIYGPYEERKVIKEGNNSINGPRQGTFIELDNGESWFAHFQDLGVYGRGVCLEPAKWENDWPIAGIDVDNDGIGEPVETYKKPNVSKEYDICVPQTSDDFDSNKLGLQWQWHSNSKNGWYSLTENKGNLRLYSVEIPSENKILFNAGNLLLQKFPGPVFEAETYMNFDNLQYGDRAGIIISGLEYHYLAVSKDEGEYNIALVEGYNGEKDKEERILETKKLSLSQGKNIGFRVSVGEGGKCQFAYSENCSDYVNIGNEFNASKGRWIGSKVGLFCSNINKNYSRGYVDYKSFEVK
jgi:beta-xylosidase